jgi:hypothetical protein
MKKLVFSAILMLQAFSSFAQMPTGINGKVIDSKTQLPLQSVVVSISNTNLTQLTDSKGGFSITGVAKGTQLLRIKSDGYKDQLLQIDIESGKMLELGTVYLEHDVTAEQQNALITITETELSDEGSGSESTASLLQASRDVFLQAAAFNFGQARFSVRGLDSEYANTMINGISMNRLADGRPQFGVWGGLNDATRNQEFTNGSAPSDYAFTGIAGSQEINTRASIYRKGTRLSFLNTNTNYNFRMMATMASGMSADGWAYTISAGRRWANNGYFEGTNYSANSLFASVEKRINANHSLNFTSMFAQNKRGKNSPNTNEINSLVGEKYNSYWGWQEGEKRNSRFKNAEEPLMMLTHYWKVNPKIQINSTIAYQTGKIGNSRLDYKQTVNPDPTYYRKLPSFWLNNFDTNNNFAPDIAAANDLRNGFTAQPQLDWKEIYRLNSGNQNITKESKIVLYEDRNDEDILTFNTNLAVQISDNVFMNGGINYQMSHTKNFKNMLDLLGGISFLDKGTFGFGGQNQPNLDTPDRYVGVGDKFGYNYNIDASRLDAFTQFKFNYKKVDFYLSQSFSRSVYQREGLYKNGYWQDSSYGSYGRSEEIAFDNFGFKGGLTYKLSGRHFIDFNGIYMSKAPNHKDVFPNTRLSNYVTENLNNETVKGVDLSYVIKAPTFKARLTGYFNEVLNQTDVNFFYQETSANFVAEIATGLNKKNRGGELGLEWQATSTLKFIGVAAYGEYTITSNPNTKYSVDNTASIADYGKANLKGYKQGGMPQQAFSFGVEYRDPKFWWLGANINYLAENYIDVSIIRRTASYYKYDLANNYRTVNQDLADKYLEQEKFDPLRLLNLVGGKSWRIQGKYTIGLFANINNVLDVSYKSGGFEQSRNSNYTSDYEDNQSGSYSKFGSKYFMGYGRTYMANIYLTF